MFYCFTVFRREKLKGDVEVTKSQSEANAHGRIQSRSHSPGQYLTSAHTGEIL